MNHSVHLGPRIRFISGTINPQNGAIPGAMNCLEVAISGVIHCEIYGFKNFKSLMDYSVVLHSLVNCDNTKQMYLFSSFINLCNHVKSFAESKFL